MVLAGIERSPKIFDFRASGIPVQKRVDFFDTLKRQEILPLNSMLFTIISRFFHISYTHCGADRFPIGKPIGIGTSQPGIARKCGRIVDIG